MQFSLIFSVAINFFVNTSVLPDCPITKCLILSHQIQKVNFCDWKNPIWYHWSHKWSGLWKTLQFSPVLGCAYFSALYTRARFKILESLEKLATGYDAMNIRKGLFHYLFIAHLTRGFCLTVYKLCFVLRELVIVTRSKYWHF